MTEFDEAPYVSILFARLITDNKTNNVTHSLESVKMGVAMNSSDATAKCEAGSALVE